MSVWKSPAEGPPRRETILGWEVGRNTRHAHRPFDVFSRKEEVHFQGRPKSSLKIDAIFSHHFVLISIFIFD